MTPEEIIEHARLVRVFLESDEFKAAWESVEGELLREFREASEPEQALAVHEQMKAMQRLQIEAEIERYKADLRDASERSKMALQAELERFKAQLQRDTQLQIAGMNAERKRAEA